MDRRAFTRDLLGLLGAAGAFTVQPRPLRGALPQASPRVDRDRLSRRLGELAAFGRTPEGGISRFAYGEADLQARDYVMGLMRQAGLEVRVDAAGNILGRRAGAEEDRPPLMMGSHIDSVPEGGNFDGQVGSMGAVEVAQTLEDAGITLRHPLDVVIFQNEEAGKTGSRAMSGEVMPQELDLETRSGHTIREGIGVLGGDPDRLESARRRPGDVAGFLELHIEQGAVLEEAGIQIGVVEGIVGIKRWTVTVHGFANHAGTTPMDARRDAMLAAAQFTVAADRVLRERPGSHVGTVGRIEAHPGVPNVIPGRVELSLELRDLAMETIDSLFGDIREAAHAIAASTETTFAYDHFYTSQAAPTDPRIRSMVAESAAELGLSTLAMPSGAGHDAQSIAQFAPVGMVFVPSIRGISHSPEERTATSDIVNGANTLLHTLLRLDATSLI